MVAIARLNSSKRDSLEWLSLEAEREGFEPPVPCGTAVFKTAVIDHSTISPSDFGRKGNKKFRVES